MKKLRRTLCQLGIFSTIFTMVSFTTIYGAAAQAEGIARQISALRTMLDSYATNTNARLTAAENNITSLNNDITRIDNNVDNIEHDVQSLGSRVGNVEDVLNNQTRCYNRNPTSIYWPRHPAANNRGCVSHEDLGTGEPAPPPPEPKQDCVATTVTWGGGCHSNTPTIPHGQSYNVTDPTNLSCSSSGRYDHGGTATVTCTDGQMSISNATCRNNQIDWGQHCR